MSFLDGSELWVGPDITRGASDSPEGVLARTHSSTPLLSGMPAILIGSTEQVLKMQTMIIIKTWPKS